MPNSRRTQIESIVLLLVLSIYAAAVLWRAGTASTHGFAAYYTAARLLAHDPKKMQDVYNEAWFAGEVNRVGFPGVYDIFNIQPPTMSLLMLPLSGLSPETARLVWTLFSAACLLTGLLLLGSALETPHRWAFGLFPLCFLYAPVAENFFYGQAYLLLFTLECLFVWAVLRGINAAAGLALGLLAVLKSAGIWLWLLLLLAGGWQILLWAIGAALITTAASLPWIGVAAWGRYFEMLPLIAVDPKRFSTAYQTLTSLFGRLFIADPKWNPVPAADLPFLGWIIPLVLLLVGLVISLRWSRWNASQLDLRLLTLGMFLALAVPAAPVAEGYHYALLLPAVLIAVWSAWWTRGGWREGLVLALAVLLLGAALPYRSPFFESRGWVFFAYPRLYGALLLWGWLIWKLKVSSVVEETAERSVNGRKR